MNKKRNSLEVIGIATRSVVILGLLAGVCFWFFAISNTVEIIHRPMASLSLSDLADVLFCTVVLCSISCGLLKWLFHEPHILSWKGWGAVGKPLLILAAVVCAVAILAALAKQLLAD